MNRNSPLSLSALAVAHYSYGNVPEAAATLEQAVRERARWPESLGKYRKAEEYRDCYLLAVILYDLEMSGKAAPNEPAWMEAFQRAEGLYRESVDPCMDYAEVFVSVRERARVLLSQVLKEREGG